MRCFPPAVVSSEAQPRPPRFGGTEIKRRSSPAAPAGAGPRGGRWPDPRARPGPAHMSRPTSGSPSPCPAFRRRVPHLAQAGCGWANCPVTRCPRRYTLRRRATRASASRRGRSRWRRLAREGHEPEPGWPGPSPSVGHGVRSLDLSEDLLGSLVVIRPSHRTSWDTGALPESNNGSSAGMAHGRSTTGDALSVEGSGEGSPGQRPGHRPDLLRERQELSADARVDRPKAGHGDLRRHHRDPEKKSSPAASACSLTRHSTKSVLSVANRMLDGTLEMTVRNESVSSSGEPWRPLDRTRAVPRLAR